MSQLPQERLGRFAEVFDLDTEAKASKPAADSSRLRRTILHRGGNVDAPENTLEAIQQVSRLRVSSGVFATFEDVFE